MDIFEVSGASERQATFSIIYQPHQKHKSAMRAVCGSDGHVLMSNKKICDCEWQETYFFRRSGKFRGRNGRWRGERHSGKHSDDSVQASHQPTSSHRHFPTQRTHRRPLARWATHSLIVLLLEFHPSALDVKSCWLLAVTRLFSWRLMTCQYMCSWISCSRPLVTGLTYWYSF